MAAFSHCSFLLSSFSDHPLFNSTLSSSNDTSLMPPVKLENPHDDDVVLMKKKKKKRVNYTNGPSKQEGTEGRSKKQRKSKNSSSNNGGVIVKQDGKEKITQKAPTGYIHVRARRGEATDSHSLAERVRREKISERMKMLQRLVPGCDKITGKALVLDEIINYVHSLQNQVEFLSMKLASVNATMFGDFTMGQDTLMGTPDRLNNSVASPLLPSVPQCSTNNQVTNFGDEYSATVLLQGSRSNDVFTSMDVVSELWDEAEDQRQNFPNNPSSFNTNLWSFQC